MATIIGVSGKIASGKDYFTGKLTDKLQHLGYRTTTTAFAVPLKAELDEVIALIRKHADLDNTDLAAIIATHMNFEITDAELLIYHLREEVTQDETITAYSRTVAVRQSLQDLGTTIRRRQNPTYWTEKFLDFVDNADADFVFVSDARFPNEMDTVVDNNGIAFRLDVPEEILAERRNNRDNITYTPEQLNHISETALDSYTRFARFIGPVFDITEIAEWAVKKSTETEEPTETPAPAFLPANTGIYTEKGYTHIENLKVGDKVLTQNGEYAAVTETFKQKVGDSTSLHTAAQASYITPTDTLFYVKTSKEAEPSWIEAANLTTGMFLAQPLTKLISEPLNEEETTLAYITGVLVQCSTSTMNEDRRNSHNSPYTDELFLSKLDSVGATHQTHGKHVLIHHPDLERLTHLFGANKWTRHIPEEILHESEEWITAFLDGFFSHGDECGINSKDLLLGITRLMQSVNPDQDIRIISLGYNNWSLRTRNQIDTHTDENHIWVPLTADARTKAEASSLEVYGFLTETGTSFYAEGVLVGNVTAK